jgi:hypothetical protein
VKSIHENKYSLLGRGKRDVNVNKETELAQFDIHVR